MAGSFLTNAEWQAGEALLVILKDREVGLKPVVCTQAGD
jgi:hypothetical protein